MSESGAASTHVRKTVLIVDDDQGTLHVLKNGIGAILDMFDVLTATNGREAIEHLEGRHVDALVTDLAMPVMDGFELIAYVTTYERVLPVIVLSGLASSDVDERLAPYGGLHVLAKPASYQDVADALLQAMEQVELGHVEGIPLSGVLQLVESERRSCTVVVTSGRRKGRLSFQSGRLIDAFSEDFGADGEAAAYDILGWHDTSIAFEHLTDTVRRTIHTPMQLMLIEVAVTQDAALERTERSIPEGWPPSIDERPATSGAGDRDQVEADAPGHAGATHAHRDGSADPDGALDEGRASVAPDQPTTTSPQAMTAEPSVTARSPNGSVGAADDAAPPTTPTDRSDEGTTMTATNTHVTTLLGAVERLTNRAREADAALAAVATEVEAFREAQRAFDAAYEQREQRRRELEAFRHDVASLAREILGRVDGMFSTESAAKDEQHTEAGTTT